MEKLNNQEAYVAALAAKKAQGKDEELVAEMKELKDNL